MSPWQLRRIGLCLSVVSILACCAQARADVGPPVEIKMALDTGPAVSGRVYAGVFEVYVFQAGTLADFKLLGDGWRLLSLETPGDPVSVQPGVVRIPFRAVPTDADEPIGLSLTYNRRRVAKSAPVGPAHFAQAGKPYRLEHIPGTSAAMLDEAKLDARRDDDEGQPRGDGARGQYHFVGRIVYSRPCRDLRNPDTGNPPDGDCDDPWDIPARTVGVDNIDVRILDNDTDGFEEMWSGYTDENGNFDTGVFSWEGSPTDPDPDLVLYCETEVTGVVDVTESDWEEYTYTFSIGEIENFQGSYHDFGWYFPEPAGLHPALHIFNSVVRTRRFIQEKPAYITPEVQIEWPDNSKGGGAWYERDSVEIHISTEHQWHEETLSHEYGHHFIACTYDPDPPSPNYCNGFCDMEVPCTPGEDCPDHEGHCLGCPENEHDAWNEGFSNWLADVVTRDYPNRYTHEPEGIPFVPLYTFSQESPDVCCQDDQFHDPLITETFVGALLRDMEDETQDDHDDDPTSATSFDGIFDLMCLGPNEIFRIVYEHQPMTVAEFISAFLADNPEYTGLFWPTAFNVGGAAYVSAFPADTEPPGVVLSCGSPTHPLGTGGSLPCITFEWWAAPDDVRGASEYSYLVTPDPAGVEPDELAEPVRGTDTCTVAGTVEVWELGEHYFCVKARDNAGNWSSQWAKFGPFEIIDCNGSGILDACDINCYHLGVSNICTIPSPSPCVGTPGCGLSNDCQPNLIPDECDIANGTSKDCNENGVPDECEDMFHWADTTGSWHVAGNWLEGQTPTANAAVCIDVSGDETVTYSTGSLQIASLGCSENLAIEGTTGSRALTLTEPSFVLGNLRVKNNDTVLQVNERLDIAGLFEWTGSSVSNTAKLKGAGVTYANGGVQISDIVYLDGHRLILDGNSTSVTTTGRVIFISPSVFEIRPGSTYEHQGNGSIVSGWFSDRFVNGGTLIKSVDPGSSNIYMFTENNGLIHVQTGTLQFYLYGSSTGDLLADPGTTLHFVDGGFAFYAGSSVVAHTVIFGGGGGGWSSIYGTWDVAGPTTVRGGQVTFTDTADVISYGSSFYVTGGTVNFNAPIGGPIQFATLSVGPGGSGGTANFNSGDPVQVTNLLIGPGSISGPGDITVSGLMTWNPAGSIAGPGTINANGGLLVSGCCSSRGLYSVFNNAATATFLSELGLSGTAVFNNLPGALMDIQFDSGASVINSGTLNNAGTLVKTAGTGTSWISSKVTNTGTVEIQAGTLKFYTYYGYFYRQTAGQTILNGGDLGMMGPAPVQIDGGLLTGSGTITGNVVNAGGTTAPGLPTTGQLDVVGTYTQGATGALEIELGGASQGVSYDCLHVTGTATLSGSLALALVDNFDPNVGDTFTVLTAGSVTGTFADVTTTDFPPTLDVSVHYDPTAVVVEIVAGEALGDLNCDGVVNVCDLPHFVQALVDPAGYDADHDGDPYPVCDRARADINDDQAIDGADIQPFVNLLLAP